MTRELIIPGKWVLLGEHSVLRTGGALSFPHPELNIRLGFEDRDQPLKIYPEVSQPMVLNLLDTLCSFARRKMPRGILRIESTLPPGAGLGSSAALCVGLSRLFLREDDPRREFELAMKLENIFHGQSSGMDVASVLVGAPIYYSRIEGWRELNLKKLPRFTLHDTGRRTSTRECVEAVLKCQGKEISAIDGVMAQAVTDGYHALGEYAESGGNLERLSSAIKRGQDCFRLWGLVPEIAETMGKMLEEQGALAWKLTGAGRGGFLVALWPDSRL